MSHTAANARDQHRVRIAAIAGDSAMRAYDQIAEHHRERTDAFILALPDLSDRDFITRAAVAIYDSAWANSQGGNWWHLHAQADACYQESERHKAAAHGEDCTGTSLYVRAWSQAVRDGGHPAMAADVRPCTCPSTASPTPATSEEASTR